MANYFDFGSQQNLSFCTKCKLWVPWILKVQSCGFPKIFVRAQSNLPTQLIPNNLMGYRITFNWVGKSTYWGEHIVTDIDLHAILSLLWTFASRFLKASFSSFCSLQQLELEVKPSWLMLFQSSSDPSESSSLLLSPMTFWKWIPLLGLQARFDCRPFPGVVACLRLAGVLSVHWAGMDGWGGACWVSTVGWTGVAVLDDIVEWTGVAVLNGGWFICDRPRENQEKGDDTGTLF